MNEVQIVWMLSNTFRSHWMKVRSLDFEVLSDKLANPNRVNVLLVATRTEKC